MLAKLIMRIQFLDERSSTYSSVHSIWTVPGTGVLSCVGLSVLFSNL